MITIKTISSINDDVLKLEEAIRDSYSGDATVAFKARSAALAMVCRLEGKLQIILEGAENESKKNNKGNG